MSTLLLRDRSSLLDELVGWMGTTRMEPQIRVEEYVEDGQLIVRADIPGVDPVKDIHLTVQQGLLRLSAERRFEERDQHRSEIRYGSFERVISLPAGTRPEDVTATYAHGVLTVTMPTGRDTESTRIPVTQPASQPEERPPEATS